MSEPLGEFGLIDWIRRHAPRPIGARTVTGIGDDCAVLDTRGDGHLLATTDMLMDGRHFILARDGAEAVGYKALGVNLSDVAAMAGVPREALIAVALPREHAVELALGLVKGARAMADRFGVELVGGDTNTWNGPLVIAVTILGSTTPLGTPERKDAHAGDAILVTGPLGGSLYRGRHLRPDPRIELALELAETHLIHAMIDISDGLAGDLGHILEQSGKGAILDAQAIPIHHDAIDQAREDGKSPLEHALTDGEDFELCLTVPAPEADALLNRFPTLHRVGTITASLDRVIVDQDGQPIAWPTSSFDHLRPRA